MTVPNRLPALTHELLLADEYPVRMSIAYDMAGHPVEIVLKPGGRSGKSGQGLELLFSDLAVALSRALQGRDPKTGLNTPHEGAPDL